MLPDGWRQCLISDIGEVQSGRQRSPHFTAGKLRPYLRVANVFDGYIDTSDVLQMYFSDSEFETFRLRNGDILLNEGQSLELVGRSAVYKGNPPDCCFQNTLIRFKPNADTFPDYAQHLFQFLLYTGRFAAIASRTTSIAHLGAGRFAGLSVRVPPFPEQKKISATLTAWDHAIELTEKLLAANQQRKAALMQQLLAGKVRLPGFRAEWRSTRVGQFLTESRIVGSSGDSARKLTVKLYGKGVIPKADPRPGSVETKYYKRRAGQFIYSKLDFLNGAFGIIPAELDGYESTLDLPAFNVGADVDPRWFLFFVTRESFYRTGLSLANGGRKARRVNPLDFLKSEILLPHRQEQSAIADVIATATQELDLRTRKLDALRRQKKGLMQQLLTGRVQVRVDEPPGV